MLLCEFCIQYQSDGACRLGLDIPKRMSCRMFDPSVMKFCSNPADFVNAAQLVQMAAFFDIKGAELKKIKLVATQEVENRLAPPPAPQGEAPRNDPYLPPTSTGK